MFARFAVGYDGMMGGEEEESCGRAGEDGTRLTLAIRSTLADLLVDFTLKRTHATAGRRRWHVTSVAFTQGTCDFVPERSPLLPEKLEHGNHDIVMGLQRHA